LPRKTTYFKVGLFALAAFAVLTAAILFFGISQAMKPSLNCETYFNHSVQGLANGSSVQFRGFKVGQVSSISLARENGEGLSRQLVKVTYSIDPTLLTGNSISDVDAARSFLESEIKNGLRIFFSFQGISGISLLNLDYAQNNQRQAGPASPAQGAGEAEERAAMPDPLKAPGEAAALRPAYATDSLILVIPSAPGTIMEFGESMTQILRSVREVDFQKLNDELTSLLGNLNQISAELNRRAGGFSDELSDAVSEVKNAAAEVAALADNLNGVVEELALGGRLKELESAIGDTRTTLRNMNNLLKLPQSTLPTTLENLRVMSENLRELSEMARQYPSQILLGDPPPRTVAPAVK
jgi:phospholipid/cholesterol/gamma-HCH transport system substrate-binding protein/paraquat-inducible protein B